MKEISELPWFEVNKLITQFQRKFNMKVEKKLQVGIQLANSKVEVFRLFLVVVELLQFIRRLKEHSFFPFECSQHIFHKMTLQIGSYVLQQHKHLLQLAEQKVFFIQTQTNDFGFYTQDKLLSYTYIEAGMYIALVELLGLFLRGYTTADYVSV